MEDPDKVEFMRTVNRELADAQRQLLNLQVTVMTVLILDVHVLGGG